ncbi:MAG: ribonuclease III [Nitrosospira sp.]|nr:ribonuclease III [Nitrosospira sp.]MSQ04982.1 ribonuclease III [Nitrosomonadaceae bacterium]MBI0408051.1 ribonuclease III [Nitrosospira sp.]MBI0414024.1 ribonuclease III [Nitrosospira sp.]MBI0415382.1 ribonuclease III [Nitrosospira sp.]
MSAEELCLKLNYQFNKLDLLQQALTHRSYSSQNNERLEFLGDSILNCIITGLLFKCFPDSNEGDLSRFRASLVNQRALSALALVLDLGKEIRLGDGELKDDGYSRPSILADSLEAILGAIYLDAGFEGVQRVVTTLFMSRINKINLDTLEKDPKTILQEYLQKHKLPLPHYSVIATSGDAHQQLFRIECSVRTLGISEFGEGVSHRNAQQKAALLVYKRIHLYSKKSKKNGTII